ncbi:MAG: hypothetical protein IID61_12300 [SAR324 cluster bacterium]|nr:hypothetical protein [SAR324 cluster bacterium]
MKIVRIYSDSDGESHFEDRDVPLRDRGLVGALSDKEPATGIVFRTTGPDYDYDWHNAPERQYVIMLQGEVEIETSDGTVRRLGAGDILLAEDTTGKGHRSRSVGTGPRQSVFVTLD